MLMQLSRKYLSRPRKLERKIVSSVTGRFRPDPSVTAQQFNGVDALRACLEEAGRRVAHSERMVDGWRDLINRKLVDGGDVTVARSLLDTFQASLDRALSEKQEAEKALTRRLRDLFEGVNRRPPNTDRELEAWLASAEGKAATAFEPSPCLR
jgi:hypothetical protein